MAIERTDCIQRVDHVAVLVGEREVAVMHVEQGAYYGLNEVASRVWELTCDQITFAALCEQLMREYEIDAERCVRDVAQCVEQMAAQGLVRVVSG